ncbi:hypothetical protein BJY04DRAFT_215184 [Aspergillus karnatakaensis]|uniref:Zn(II)2Cys6 transcription factor domain-containing protein n=1 Tax=Aspergillus karnatakaensis TaxID=1810916 RepID=UPI003CCDF568
MVYPGGPSRGCYTCRARKVKCDEGKPVCKRCTKGNRTCGGYRVLDNKKAPSKPTGLVQGTSAARDQDLIAQQLQSLLQCPNAVWGPNGNLNIDSLSAFYESFGWLPQVQSFHGGFLTTIPVLLASLKEPDASPLPQALTALLLAFVSERHGEDHGAVTAAMTCYGNALQLIRQLIEGRNPERTIEFLMTIFVLGVYEDLASADCTKMTSNSHLKGAIAFIREHKCKRFEDEISRKIYIALLARAVYTCLDDLKDDSPFVFTLAELQSLHAELSKDPNANRRALQACTLLIIHLQLRQLEEDEPTINGTATVNIPARANILLQSITSIDNQMTDWERSVSPENRFMTIQLPQDDCIDLWTSNAHVYPTFSAANDWAGYRTVRILAHSLSLRAYRLMARPHYEYDSPEYGQRGSPLAALASDIAMAHSRIRALADDMCASMPYHVGYRTKSGCGIRYPSEPFPDGKFPRLMSTCHIFWPLYLAGVVEGVDLEQRLWISRQLDFINSEFKIGRAAVLAELVRREAVMEVQDRSTL